MPRLSFVVAGRNDDYDGNFDDRLTIALSKNVTSLPDAEFIFVEWNPIRNKTLVCRKLQRLFGDRIKYIVVHPKYHPLYCTIDDFLEYPAKNVGIRNATGDFVACINSDILISPEVVKYLNGPLKPKVAYRAVRVDINLEYLNVKFPVPKDQILEENFGVTNACGDFLMVDRATWYEYTGYCEAFPEQRLHKDSLMMYLFVDVGKMPVEVLGRITHWRHPSSWSNNQNRGKVGNVNWRFTKTGFRRNGPNWGLVLAKTFDFGGIRWLM